MRLGNLLEQTATYDYTHDFFTSLHLLSSITSIIYLWPSSTDLGHMGGSFEPGHFPQLTAILNIGDISLKQTSSPQHLENAKLMISYDLLLAI